MKTRTLITCLLLTGCGGTEFSSAQDGLDSTSLPHDDGGSVREPDAGTAGTHAGGSGGATGTGGAHAGGSGGSSVDRDAGTGGTGSAGAHAGGSGGVPDPGTGGVGSGGTETGGATGSGGAQATGGAGGVETGGGTSSGGTTASGGQMGTGGTTEACSDPTRCPCGSAFACPASCALGLCCLHDARTGDFSACGCIYGTGLPSPQFTCR